MNKGKYNSGNISDKLRLAFDEARLKFLRDQASRDGVVIITDKDGNILRIPAKEMLLHPEKYRRQ